MADNTDIRIVVGGEIEATYNQLKQDLQTVARRISDEGSVKIKVEIDSSQFLEKLRLELKGTKLESIGTELGGSLSSGISNGMQNISSNVQNQIKIVSDTAKSIPIEIPIRASGEYTGEQLAEIFDKISKDIQTRTGALPKISIREIFSEEGSEITRASVQYINKELGTTVKTFYDIKTAEDGTIAATESFRDSVINTGSALKEINVSFEKAFAEERIRTLQARTEGLNVDFTKLSDASKNIVDITSLQNFNNEFKILEQQIKTIRASIQSETKLDPIAAMQIKLERMPSAIELVQTRLQKFSQIPGFDEINKKAQTLNELLAQISKPKEDGVKKTATEQLQAFEALRKTLVEVNDQMKILSARKGVETKPSFDAQFEGQLDPTKIQKWQERVDLAVASLQIFESTSQNASTMIQNLQNTMSTLKGSENIDQQNIALVGLQQNIRDANAEFRRMLPVEMESKVIQLRTTIEAWLTNNTAAAKQFGDRMRELIGQLSDPSTITRGQFQEIGNQFRIAATEADAMGVTTDTLSMKLGNMIRKFSAWYSTTRIIMEIIRLFKQMVSTVIELDTQMTELVKLTGITGNAYNKFLDDAIIRAKNLNASIADVVQSTADFTRMGLGLEEAKEAADAALVFKNVAYGIDDVSTASEHIIATLKSFGLNASQSMEIVDKFTASGNKFAITSSDIGEGVKNAGAALAGTNNTLDETIGLLIASNNSLQDISKSSTALRTIALRLQSTKGELEELGEDAEGAAESVTKLQTQLLNLTKGKIDIMIDES